MYQFPFGFWNRKIARQVYPRDKDVVKDKKNVYEKCYYVVAHHNTPYTDIYMEFLAEDEYGNWRENIGLENEKEKEERKIQEDKQRKGQRTRTMEEQIRQLLKVEGQKGRESKGYDVGQDNTMIIIMYQYLHKLPRQYSYIDSLTRDSETINYKSTQKANRMGAQYNRKGVITHWPILIESQLMNNSLDIESLVSTGDKYMRQVTEPNKESFEEEIVQKSTDPTILVYVINNINHILWLPESTIAVIQYVILDNDRNIQEVIIDYIQSDIRIETGLYVQRHYYSTEEYIRYEIVYPEPSIDDENIIQMSQTEGRQKVIYKKSGKE